MVSDVHLPQRTPEEKAFLLRGTRPPFSDGAPADVLFLCGDVGNPQSQDYERFLKRVADLYALVLLVPGNHEYVWTSEPVSSGSLARVGWRPDFDGIKARLDSFELRLGGRLKVLDDGRRIRLPGVLVGGATLWTNVAPSDDEALALKLRSSYAWFRGREFEPDDVRSIHRSHVRALQDVAEEANREQLEACFLTHHCPWGLASRKMESVYVTDLPRERPGLFVHPVRTWCYGHTHRPFDGFVGSGSCRLLSNPMGYPRENISYDRRKRLCFALPQSTSP